MFENKAMMNESMVGGIMALPDEMIMKILSYLKNIEIFYSFVDVNERFDRLVRDPLYTRSIQFAEKRYKGKKSFPLSNFIIDRFCADIFPHIHQSIECLILEPFSLKCILLAAEYPRLHKLIFTEVNEDFLSRHMNGKIRISSLYFFEGSDCLIRSISIKKTFSTED